MKAISSQRPQSVAEITGMDEVELEHIRKLDRYPTAMRHLGNRP